MSGSGGFLGVPRFPRCDVDLPSSFVIGDVFNFSVPREQSQNSFGSEGYNDSPIGKDRMEQRVFMFILLVVSAERVCVEIFIVLHVVLSGILLASILLDQGLFSVFLEVLQILIDNLFWSRALNRTL